MSVFVQAAIFFCGASPFEKENLQSSLFEVCRIDKKGLYFVVVVVVVVGGGGSVFFNSEFLYVYDSPQLEGVHRGRKKQFRPPSIKLPQEFT